ncbi:MAG TPA: hypothetical protein VMH77_05750 [Steroidobacteraceae bacterium]|nr:hypothetical protein [Steroidobacteraceae bacterium]
MRHVAGVMAWLLLAPQISSAAMPAASASTWTISGNDAVFSYTFPRSLATTLATPGAPSPSVEAIAHYVFSRTSARRQAQPCEAVDQGYDLGRIDTRYLGPDLLSFEIFFRCAAGPGPLLLRNDSFFDRSPGQLGIARVRVAGRSPVLRLLTAGHTGIAVGTGPVPASPAGAYLWLGCRHVLAGALQLCMAVALMLLIRNRRDLLLLACGLAGGYAVAAAAGAAGWFLQPAPSQAFRGLLLLFGGALLVTRGSGRPRIAAIGLLLLAGVAAAIAASLGRSDAALCLLGAGVAGALTVPLTVTSAGMSPRWLLPAVGILAGGADGFSFGSLFAPLHAVVSPGMAQLLAFNLGALLGVAAAIAAAAAARGLLLRRFGVAPVSAELVTAALVAAGAFSILAI